MVQNNDKGTRHTVRIRPSGFYQGSGYNVSPGSPRDCTGKRQRYVRTKGEQILQLCGRSVGRTRGRNQTVKRVIYSQPSGTMQGATPCTGFTRTLVQY